MMKSCLNIAMSLTMFFIAPAYAQGKTDFSALVLTEEAQVTEIVDPLRLRLLDGRIVQLSGIDIPDLTPYDTGDIGLAAMALLKESALQKHVKLYQSQKTGKERMNRMGYHLAQVAEKNNDLWIQGLLLEQGLARVRPTGINFEMALPMMALEQNARQEKRGLWADEQYAVLTAENAEKAMHGWGIIEGTIQASAMAKNMIFLNFGHDWRTDFTVGISPSVRRELEKEEIDPLQLTHKHVRVRGWVEDYNGAYIELMNSIWIEILPETVEHSKLD